MLFLFRSAPKVEKRIHSKFFRKFWEEPGYKRADLHYCTIVALGFDTNCLQLMNSGMVCLSVGVTTLQENKSVHCTLGPHQLFQFLWLMWRWFFRRSSVWYGRYDSEQCHAVMIFIKKGFSRIVSVSFLQKLNWAAFIYHDFHHLWPSFTIRTIVDCWQSLNLENVLNFVVIVNFQIQGEQEFNPIWENSP